MSETNADNGAAIDWTGIRFTAAVADRAAFMDQVRIRVQDMGPWLMAAAATMADDDAGLTERARREPDALMTLAEALPATREGLTSLADLCATAQTRLLVALSRVVEPEHDA